MQLCRWVLQLQKSAYDYLKRIVRIKYDPW